MGSGTKTYLSAADLAKHFKVAPNSIKSWVSRWERSKEISPVERTAGQHRRFQPHHITEIEALLKKTPGTSVSQPPSVTGTPHVD